MSVSDPSTADTSLVHIPSTMASWEVDSASDSDPGSASDQVEEIEEVCTPYPDDVSYDNLPPGCSAFRRHSLIHSNGHGDDLPGAKARKVMGMSMDSQFNDSDDEEDGYSSSTSQASLTRSISLRNPFKKSESIFGHRRGASLDVGMHAGEQSGLYHRPSSARKRRPSLSDVLGLPNARSDSTSSAEAVPPLDIPSRSSSSLSIRRPIQAVLQKEKGSTTKKKKEKSGDNITLSNSSQIENEWSAKLVEAAREAEWQTAIEHRPKQPGHFPKGDGHHRAIYPIPAPSSESDEAVASPAADCVDPSVLRRSGEARPHPSLSPALSGHLEQIATGKSTHHQHGRSASIDSIFQPLSFAAVPTQRRPSLPTPSSAPPRPLRSSKREAHREAESSEAAAPTPPPKDEEESVLGSQLIEYLDGCDVEIPADDYFGGAETASPACSSTGSSISRYSGSSLTFSDEALLNTTDSPGLSSSTSASFKINMESTPLLDCERDVPQAQNSVGLALADTGRPISPFMSPRKAPNPPPLNALAAAPWRRSVRKVVPLPPPLLRQDSSVDPDYLQAGSPPQHGEPVTDLHHQVRPLSVPFSPASAQTEELDFEADAIEGEDEDQDEFLSALDKLGSHLHLSHALTLGQGYGDGSPPDRIPSLKASQIDSSCLSSRQSEDIPNRENHWSSDRDALHFLQLYSSS